MSDGERWTVTMTVRQAQGPRSFVTEFDLETEPYKAIQVYQEALRRLTEPDMVVFQTKEEAEAYRRKFTEVQKP